MLEAKGIMYGRDVRIINRWEPTSQKCSFCGFNGGKKELKVSEWQCLNCGAIHDRDVNAAKNIRVAGGLSETKNGRGGKCKTIAKIATPVESSTILRRIQSAIVVLGIRNPHAFRLGRSQKLAIILYYIKTELQENQK